MGLLTTIKKQQLKDKELRIILLGLDNSGKSSFINYVLNKPKDNITPTMGFEIIPFPYKSHTLNFWDIGGQSSIRNYWFNYFNDKLNVLIYIIDLLDSSRYSTSFNQFNSMINNDQLINVKTLVLLNKFDLYGKEVNHDEIVKELDLKGDYKVLVTSTKTGLNIDEALEYIVS